MARMAIARETDIGRAHQTVPCGFGDDRGGGYGQAFGVAFDDSLNGYWDGYVKCGAAVAVYENCVWRSGQIRHGALHGYHGGGQNIDTVYFFGFRYADAHMGRSHDNCVKRFAFSLGQFFAVI